MNTPPRVSIIVLNWNGAQDTLACLDSLSSLKYSNFDVILVDNGSTDDSLPIFHSYSGPFPLTLLETGENLGFAEGNNFGIRKALERASDYILLLNNDTVVDANLIDEFVAGAQSHPDGGIFGAKIYYHSEPNKIWAAGGFWNNDKKHFDQYGDGELDNGQHDEARKNEFTIGCAMFIRRSVFEKIGLLESEFFLNYEEIDFCTRAQNSGFKNIYIPGAKLWHKISASFGGEEAPLKIYFTFRNRLLWAKRNLPIFRRISIHLSVYSGAIHRLLIPFLKGAPGTPLYKGMVWAFVSALRSPANQAWLMGIRDFWLGRFGNCPPDVWALQSKWKLQKSAHAVFD